MNDDLIERLLEDARAACGPVAWPRVERLIEAIVGLYGEGLARALELAGDEVRHKLANDELVGSLLTLHGLHPRPLLERIEASLERASASIGAVKLVAVEDDVARIKFFGGPIGAPDQLRELLERMVLEAAPELRAVAIDGLPGDLVQIDLQRSRLAAR